jgi:hypothetical protein
MSRLPQIGDPIALRDAGGLVYASRVEGIDDDEIAVARPADLRAALVYDVGLALDLIWTESTGIHVLPTELASTAVDNHIRLWNLTVTGEAWTEQRRNYVRVPLSGRIVLTPTQLLEGAPEPVEATFIDLSEVAMQCAVPLPRDDPRIAVGQTLVCRFTIGDENFDVNGAVIIVRPGTSPRESRVVVQFGPSRAASDALRKHVFRIQIAIRREQQD